MGIDTVCTVDGCNRPVADNAYACVSCARQLREALKTIAELSGDLQNAVTRQTAMGGASVARSTADKPPPFDPKASELAGRLRNTVTTWVRHITNERGQTWPEMPIVGPVCSWGACTAHSSCTAIRWSRRVRTLGETARWLSGHLEWIRHRAEVPEIVDEFSRLAQQLTRTVDRPADRVYIGRCGGLEDPDACPADLYARPGADTVQCRDCGQVWGVPEQREWLLKVAEDHLATATEISRFLTQNRERSVLASTVRVLAHRGRITARGHDQHERPLYRVGDVVDVLANSADTPTPDPPLAS